MPLLPLLPVLMGLALCVPPLGASGSREPAGRSEPAASAPVEAPVATGVRSDEDDEAEVGIEPASAEIASAGGWEAAAADPDTADGERAPPATDERAALGAGEAGAQGQS